MRPLSRFASAALAFALTPAAFAQPPQPMKDALAFAGSIMAGTGAAVEAPAAPENAPAAKPASSGSALVDKFRISKAAAPADGELKALAGLLGKELAADEEDFRVIEVLKIGRDYGTFGEADLAQLLGGRFDEGFRLDLSISDAQAATREGRNSGLIVSGIEPLTAFPGDPVQSAKIVKKAVRQVVPFLTERAAKESGQEWTQASIDAAKARIQGVVLGAFGLAAIDLGDTGDATLSLLAVFDAKNGEVVLYGFGANP